MIRTCLPTCCASCGRIAYRPRPRRMFTGSADLKTEAEFLAYDALFNACDAAEAALASGAALAAPAEESQMKIFYVDRGNHCCDKWSGAKKYESGCPRGRYYTSAK